MTRRRRAVVLGAGIGGLAAAAALAPHVEAVSVYDSDRLVDAPLPRKGVQQGRHIHLLLIAGERALATLLPGIRDDLRGAGAAEVDAGQDLRLFDAGSLRPRRLLGLPLLCLGRPALEQVIRRRIAALPNVRLHDRTRAGRVLLRDGAAVGVELANGAGQLVEPADLVVDARGRSALLANQLAADGLGCVPQTRLGIDVCYVSARFRLPPQPDGILASACLPAPPDRRFGSLFPIGGGEWLVALGGRCGVAPPTDPQGFLEFARSLACPDLARRLAAAVPLGPTRRYRKPEAGWRHYDRLARFPLRLIPLGDTIASFNPIYGQGMTVAILQAVALQRALAASGPDDRGLRQAYLADAMAITGEAWALAATVDLAYPEVTGVRPPGLAETLATMAGLRRLADADPAIHRMTFEVLQMLRPVASLAEAALLPPTVQD